MSSSDNNNNNILQNTFDDNTARGVNEQGNRHRHRHQNKSCFNNVDVTIEGTIILPKT